MAREFAMQFPQQAFTVGQEIVFKFGDKKPLLLVPKDIEGWFLFCFFLILFLFCKY